jgi:hypothetical protein
VFRNNYLTINISFLNRLCQCSSEFRLVSLTAIDQNLQHPGPLGPFQGLQPPGQGESAIDEGPGINQTSPEQTQRTVKRAATATNQMHLGNHQVGGIQGIAAYISAFYNHCAQRPDPGKGQLQP